MSLLLRHAVRATTLAAMLAAALAAALATTATTTPVTSGGVVLVAEPFDPEVILPGRVDATLHRTYDAVRRSVARVDDHQHRKARTSLESVRSGFVRSLRVVQRQVEAVQPPDSESTAGPDSVLAHLNVSGTSVHQLAGLYDGLRPPRVVDAVSAALVAAQQRRATLIAQVTALDPEGDGAPYADALIDTVANYTDEVAGLQEALDDDRLTPAARAALEAALARSRSAEAAMLAAYGGSD